LRLVDDQHGARVGRRDVVAPPAAQRLEAIPAIVRGERDREEVAELAVKVAGPRLRVLDRADHDVGQRSEPPLDEAEDGALASAWISAEQDEAAVADARLDASEKCIDDGIRVKRLDRDIGPEGVEFQAKQGLELAHRLVSSSSPMSMVESRGKYAGGSPVAA
jgi:hypothetical protein